jgi:hypothetical protein
MRSLFINTCFLFKVGSVCRVKQFTTWSGSCHLAGKHVAHAEEVETCVRKWLRQQSKRFPCCGFRRTGKIMGKVYHCWWRYVEKCFFPGSNITRFTFHIHLWPIYWLSLVLRMLSTVRGVEPRFIFLLVYGMASNTLETYIPTGNVFILPVLCVCILNVTLLQKLMEL